MKKITTKSPKLLGEGKVDGRPSKYKEEYCQTIREYFAKPVLDKDGKLNTPPTLYGFASQTKVCHDTLHEWAKNHPNFSEAMKECKATQSQFIIDATFTGKSNPAFSIFMMKNICGWRDKTEVDQTVSLKPSIIQKIDGTQEVLSYRDDDDEE